MNRLDNQDEIHTNSIEHLFDTYGKDVYITEDNRHFASLPDIELEYYDEKNRTIRWGSVAQIEKHYVNKKMFNIILENDLNVKVTEDHSLVVVRNGKLEQTKVSELENDDFFITTRGRCGVKNIIELERKPRWVYDITMDVTPHTFFANNILVHNSCFLTPKEGSSIETLRKDVDRFNEIEVTEELLKKYNPDLPDEYNFYNLETETEFDYIYFGDSKKRYYAIKKDGEKYVHGLNIIRKDTPKFIKDILTELADKSVREKIEYKDLEDTFEKIKNADYRDIAVHKYISKPFHMYKKTMPQHVAGAVFANKLFNLPIKNSDVVYLFYIINKVEMDKKPAERNGVMCLRTEDFTLLKESQDKVEIDYIELFEKQIIQPLREFSYIPKVVYVIDKWCGQLEEKKMGYKKNRKGEFVFDKIVL